MNSRTIKLHLLVVFLMTGFLVLSKDRGGAGYSTVARLLAGSGAVAETAKLAPIG